MTPLSSNSTPTQDLMIDGNIQRSQLAAEAQKQSTKHAQETLLIKFHNTMQEDRMKTIADISKCMKSISSNLTQKL